MKVRQFQIGDELALHEVFYSAVHTLAANDYSAEQREAWAPGAFDVKSWTERMRRLRPFVVESEERIVGYADLQEDGYIDHFFVAGDQARRGVGRLLMMSIRERAASLGLASLFSDVSRTAEPFFAHFGFRVSER